MGLYLGLILGVELLFFFLILSLSLDLIQVWFIVSVEFESVFEFGQFGFEGWFECGLSLGLIVVRLWAWLWV